MEVRQIAEGLAVAGQITVDDLPTIANLGYRTLISNRPDSEEGTTPHDRIREAAEEAGLEFHYVPVVSGAITSENVSDMTTVLNSAEHPVLAYCRSGARCMKLLQLVEMAG